MENSRRYEVTTKEGWLYGTGNMANNLIFMFVGTYLTYYFTNVLGINAKVAGTIFLVSRLIDAVTDPLMGMICDHTNTKMGKYRPYVVFGTPVLAIIFAFLFTTPSYSMGGKVAYAYIIYIMYSLAWTVVQIPQLSVPVILSSNVAKRTKIMTIYQGFGSIASMIVTSWALPMLKYFGGMDNPAAWRIVVIIFAGVATIFLQLSAHATRKIDVYNPNAKIEKEKGKKVPFSQQLSVITKNRALLMILLAYGTDMFAGQIAMSFRIHFFKYNMGGRTDLIPYLGYVQFVVGFGLIFVIQPFCKKIGKKIGIFWAEALAIIPPVVMIFAAPAGNITLVMGSLMIGQVFAVLTNTLSRSAVADSANYAQIKTGINGNGLVSSTFTFVNKCAQAFSMYFAGSILSSTGYNPQLQQQAPQTLNAILMFMTVLPIAGFVCSLVAMIFYPISRKDEVEMEDKMRKIRAAELAAAVTVDSDANSISIP
jgi:sugar (glycoside-pentoside-hexuronide) transporter